MSHVHLPRIFQDILHSIEVQPAQLRRAAMKADPKRFNEAPHSAFSVLSVERMREIGDEERECERSDARRDELFGSEE